MESSRRRSGILLLFIIFLALNCACLVYSDRRITVGDNQFWKPNVNYTKWSEKQHFYVGNWLYFVYEKNQFSVLEVNKTGYERCSIENIIRNFTGGAGRDVVQLNESRPYYFISGGGYCWGGMKLPVLVEDQPVPAPTPTKNASPPSRSLYWILAAIVVAWTSSLFFIF